MTEAEVMKLAAVMSKGTQVVSIRYDGEIASDFASLGWFNTESISDLFEEIEFELGVAEVGFYEETGSLKWGIR